MDVANSRFVLSISMDTDVAVAALTFRCSLRASYLCEQLHLSCSALKTHLLVTPRHKVPQQNASCCPVMLHKKKLFL